MARRLLSTQEFAATPDADAGVYRFASVDAATVDRQTGRVIPYVLSTPNVARDGHTIAVDGWKLDAFRSNPVFLWCHDSTEPPIGRLNDVTAGNGALRGSVEYADADTYPFADTIFRLVKGGFVNAVSVCWDPIRWAYSTDRKRPGGIDFLEQELREVSQVPIPCDTGAIATARGAGIDTGPLYRWAEKILDTGASVLIARAELENLRQEARMPTRTRSDASATADWKVGAARDLPVNTTAAWDGTAAEKRVFADAGFDGGTPDPEKARGAFLFYDANAPTMKGSYKEPFADIIDGKLTAVRAGLDAAASRLDATDVPQDVKDEGKKVLDGYKPADSGRAAPARPRRRGLYQVSWFASLLDDLDWLQSCVQQEAEFEGDNSPMPARLTAILKAAGQALLDLTAEEVAEMLSGKPDGDVDVMPGDDGLRAAAAIRQFATAFVVRCAAPAMARVRARAVEGLDTATLANLLRRDMLAPSGREALADMILARSGKVLSGDNEQALRDAHDHMRAAADGVASVVAQNYPESAPDPLGPLNPPPVSDDAAGRAARAARERQAREAIASAARADAAAE